MNSKLLDRPIAFHRCFVEMFGSVNAALMLSQAIYWANRTSDPEGWFWKTREEWTHETGLTRHELDAAMKKLKSVLLHEVRGMPAKSHFKVDFSSLPKTDKQVCRKPTNLFAENRQTALYNTEITTETTSIKKEISKERKPSSCLGKSFSRPELAEVETYAAERGMKSQAERFWLYHEARGWVIGKAKMKDWKAAFRYWQTNVKTESAEPVIRGKLV